MPSDIRRQAATPMRKREDVALIKGAGCFADDAPLTNPLHVAFVRSMSLGEMVGLDVSGAQGAAGVHAVHCAQDLAHLGAPGVNEVIDLACVPRFAVLAGPQIGATGLPVAAVLAGSLAQAQDAAEMVFADIEDADHAPLVVAAKQWQSGAIRQAFEQAAHVVSCEIAHPRLAPSAMEPRAIAAAYDVQTGGVTLWHATQTPHRTRSELARILAVDAARIRVIAQHVGGAFGMKASLYPEEVFVAWAALHHRRDVRWTATRSEDFLAATHGRGITSKGSLAVDAGGNFLGLRAQVEAPLGPWLPNSALIPAWNAARILPSAYRVPALAIETRAVQVPRGPTGIYRGAGRPEATALMERLIDKAARAVGLDPVDIRQRNLLAEAELPAQTATGNLLDSGRYAQALTSLCETAGYARWLHARDARRAKGALVGVGLAFYVEPSGNGWESARVTLNTDGSARVASGSSSQGHGRETAFAQIAGEALGLPADRVTVVLGDTGLAPEGIGALASRSTAIGGSAVLGACREALTRQDAGEPLPITAQLRYENKGQAWGYGAYLVQMSVCRDTGTPRIERAICMDDAGHLVNEALVHDQIIGGFAQGIGEALMEQVVYDADGQLLTGSFMDYAMPRAADVPQLEVHAMQTPSPMNLLGAKGVGEAGTIGAPAAVLNAAVDALSPLGVTDLQMPLTPATLWQAIKDS